MRIRSLRPISIRFVSWSAAASRPASARRSLGRLGTLSGSTSHPTWSQLLGLSNGRAPVRRSGVRLTARGMRSGGAARSAATPRADDDGKALAVRPTRQTNARVSIGSGPRLTQAAGVHPGDQEQRPLGIGTRRPRDEQLMQPLAGHP